MFKNRLYAPGPVEVPPQVLTAMSQPVMYHRGEKCKTLILKVRSQLADIACVPGEDVLIVSGSGTAGFEAGLLACVPRAAKVIGVHAGKFGERWVALARHHGFDVVEVAFPWGEAADTETLRKVLRDHPDALAVMTTHSETSTGVLHPIESLARTVREETPEALFLVDCVTSLGVAELRPQEWGLDGVFAGSQKGLMTPPGLAFAWLSERAWERDENLVAGFYLDLRKERKSQSEGQTAYTPAVSLIMGLEAALELLLAEGIVAVWKRRERINRAILEAASRLGCRPYAARVSPAVAALRSPEGLSGPQIVSGFARRGVQIAGGQDHAKPFLFRPSVVGYADAYDAVTVVAVLEDVLRDLGRDVPFGLGVGTAMRVIEE
ncbi:MAG: alanine--glyoxylate aminotransferase family protein [Trueperaceae bacterium]|nr:MAG: alanine--glyoxylate aminotransferase family protein [Trueperaceae bacterium]